MFFLNEGLVSLCIVGHFTNKTTHIKYCICKLYKILSTTRIIPALQQRAGWLKNSCTRGFCFMSRIVSDKKLFNPYPYTNPTGINLHLCCKIQRSVLFVVPLLLIALQHRFCAGRVDEMMYWCWWRDRRCSCLNNFHEFPLWRPLHFTSHSINMIIRNVQKGLNQWYVFYLWWIT